MFLIKLFFRKCALAVIRAVNKWYREYVKKDVSFILSKEKPNILIINPQGYGDTVVMTPFLKSIKIKWPHAVLRVVVSQRGYEVLKNCPYIDTLLVYTPSFFQYRQFITSLRAFKIDLCFDLQLSLTNMRRWLLPAITNSLYRVYFKRGGFEGPLPDLEVEYYLQHMIDCYISLGTWFSPEHIKQTSEVFFSAEDAAWAEQKVKTEKKGVIVLHAYSENPNHLWKVKSWAKVARTFAPQYKVILTTSKEGFSYSKECVGEMNGSIELVIPETINQLAALIAKSALLVSVDTTTVHIATATMTPSVSVYGPTITKAWGPYNRNQIALQKDKVCQGRCREYRGEAIFSHIERCPEYGDNCINYISEEEVLAAAHYLLDQRQ